MIFSGRTKADIQNSLQVPFSINKTKQNCQISFMVHVQYWLCIALCVSCLYGFLFYFVWPFCYGALKPVSVPFRFR